MDFEKRIQKDSFREWGGYSSNYGYWVNDYALTVIFKTAVWFIMGVSKCCLWILDPQLLLLILVGPVWWMFQFFLAMKMHKQLSRTRFLGFGFGHITW